MSVRSLTNSPVRGPARRPARRPDRRPERAATAIGASAAGAITFPTTTDLATRVRVALGADLSADPLTWPWQDITDAVRWDEGVKVTTGRRDETTTGTGGTGSMKLDNRDGRFTRRNPTSPFWGLLSKNTPIWAEVDAGSGWKTRMEMFVNEWPKMWADRSANDATSTIRCAGVQRRLAQGQVFKSALRRVYLSNAQPVPAAYWPCEDEEGADSVASGLSTTGVTLGGITPHFATGIGGSAGALDLVGTGAGLTSSVALPSASGFQIELTGRSNGVESYISFDVYCGDLLVSLSFDVSLSDDASHHVTYRLEQSGADVAVTIYRDGVFTSSSTLLGFTLANTLQLISRPVTVAAFTPVTSGTFLVSHVAVYGYSAIGLPTTRAEAADGYAGEMAHERMTRLCAEEGVVFETVAATSQAMGPQGIDTLLALLRECETVDGGVLYEKRWGLAYLSLDERYNPPVSLALDIAEGHLADIPEPADDDQRTRNRVTVTRTDGSEYTAEQTDGPMGTGAQGPGVYDDSVTLNVATDDQLSQQAGWRLHIGTTDEDRWPDLALNFAHDPDLISAWTTLPPAARVTIAHPLSQMPPDPVDLIIEGYTERWDSKRWTASLNCSPASPYRVGAVASTSGNIGRVDAAASTLAADATSSATSLSVASTGALWRTGSVNFDINVGGERMTVTNISGGSSPQTFTVTRSVNGVVKEQPALVGGYTTKVSLWQPAVVAL